MTNQVIEVPSIEVNISPDGFHLWAQHYYKCMRDFISPNSFSPVPYFLLCRAIELQLKAFHLKTKRQTQVKTEFGHDLMRSYSALSSGDQILSQVELDELTKANEVYSSKGFEYFAPVNALRGYSNFPDLEVLEQVCQKLLGHGEFTIPKSRLRCSWLADLIDRFRRWLVISSTV